MSSILRRSSAVISPFSSLARASLMRGGRNRLPTSSARNGALVLCMALTPEHRGVSSKMGTGPREQDASDKSVGGSAGDAEIALQDGGIGLQRLTGRIMHDRAALQYHNPVGKPQNLLGILLDNNRTDAAGPGNGAERPEQFLDD